MGCPVLRRRTSPQAEQASRAREAAHPHRSKFSFCPRRVMKPYLFTATAVQVLIIWANNEDEAAQLIGDAIDPLSWDMEGAEHGGELTEKDAATYVRHGANELPLQPHASQR
jgi:hypothetical protein